MPKTILQATTTTLNPTSGDWVPIGRGSAPTQDYRVDLAQLIAGLVLGGGNGEGVSDHGALSGLADDDHPHYARADGTRGAFASVAQGAKADTAVQPFALISTDAGNALSAGIRFWSGTRAAYDAIPSKSANTIYLVEEP